MKEQPNLTDEFTDLGEARSELVAVVVAGSGQSVPGSSGRSAEPRIMSGRLRVKDAERQVEDVL